MNKKRSDVPIAELSSAVRPTPCAAAPHERFVGAVVIGVSTGGPPALAQLFAALAPPLPPIVVVQHMPAMFTRPFAERLNALSAIEVREAADGDLLVPNRAWIAPGGKHLLLRRGPDGVRTVVRDGAPVCGHKPSVDVLMRSAAAVYGRHCVAVLMTGMGSDGSDGCKEVRAAGGYVLGQNEATSDVYGMNKVAFLAGNVDRQVALDRLSAEIAAEARRRCVRRPPRGAAAQSGLCR